ncbi:hypothetical protein HDE_13256 [Halotydeus destructor]|nr:hypothetical protein HDE_13256 [Halotydeus destructor]
MNAFVTLTILTIGLTLVSAQYGGGSYGQEEEHQEPSRKLKFNIGFNVPSMSISLPKLELPQISIKASIKQRKPFQLRLPRITFNSHVSATEEDEEDKPAYGAGSKPYQVPAPAPMPVNSYVQQQESYGNQGNGGYGNNNGGNGGYGGNGATDFPGGYRAAGSYEHPEINPSPAQHQEDVNNYNGAPVNNYQPRQEVNHHQAMDSYNNRGYATGFQGQAVSDYKSSTQPKNYYAPAPSAPARDNFRPAHNGGNNNYGARVNANNQYLRRSSYQPSASNLIFLTAMPTGPKIDYSKWTPIY